MDIKEYITDGLATLLIAGTFYMYAVGTSVPAGLSGMTGVAMMYLFGKYTPNSV